MMRYRIRRDRHKPLQFTGELLAEVSTRNKRERWTELRLYRTAQSTLDGDPVDLRDSYTPSEGSYVCEQVGRTDVEGEMDRRKAWPCRTFAEIKEALGDGPLARQLYVEAGLYGTVRVEPEEDSND